MPSLSKALAVLCVLLLGRAAAAQDRFEVQVYDAETAAPAHAGVELHLNSVLDGTRSPSADGELPTHHVIHVTLEPHIGLFRWCELGAYLQAAVRPDGSLDYAGLKLRWKARLPRRLARGLLGLALNIELSAVPATYEANVYGSELRPVIDLAWRRLYLSLNPILGIDIGGARAGQPQLEPAAKAAVTIVPWLSAGLEYYGGYGSIADPLPLSEQTHRLLGVFDLTRRIGEYLDFSVNLGAGYNLSGSGDRWLLKAIIGISR